MSGSFPETLRNIVCQHSPPLLLQRTPNTSLGRRRHDVWYRLELFCLFPRHAWQVLRGIPGVDGPWSHRVQQTFFRSEIASHYDLNISRLAYFAAVVYVRPVTISGENVAFAGFRGPCQMEKCYGYGERLESCREWHHDVGGSRRCWLQSVQYAVMIFCGSRMHRKMAEKLEQFSITNRKMHRQLFKTLVIQITVPTFTIFMPVMLMFMIPFFNVQMGVPTGIILCALSLYPFIDGIIVICIVSDYRRAAIGEPIELGNEVCQDVPSDSISLRAQFKIILQEHLHKKQKCKCVRPCRDLRQLGTSSHVQPRHPAADPEVRHFDQCDRHDQPS